MITESESLYAQLRKTVPEIEAMLGRLATNAGNQALAIVASAMLEDAVKNVYVSCVLPEYVKRYKNIGFRQVALTALHLGLLHKLEFDLLHSIASIRNTFAHNWSIDSFYDPLL